MKVTAAKAEYTPASLDAFRGNPLIEALPNFLDVPPAKIFEWLTQDPEPIANQTSRRQKSEWLTYTALNCFIPGMRHMELFEIVDLMIRQGYLHRSPTIGPSYYEDAQKRFKERLEAQGLRPSAYHEPLTTSVVGCSGIGKSSGVLKVLSLYDQVIVHKPPYVLEPLTQVVYLKVEAPGTVKGLCGRIIGELGRLVGINYAEQYVKPRATLEALQQRVIYLMGLHRVGILVLDEMQNLVRRYKNRDEIFDFIVYLSNTLDVPILFIGTPKLKQFMCSNLRTARRFGTFGVSIWERFKLGTPEWESFVQALWRYQILRDERLEMSAEVQSAFYRCSQGITDILVKLFIFCQMKAILKCCLKQEKLERITPPLVEETFKTEFPHLVPLMDALSTGDEKAIESYEDIAVSDEEFTNKAKKILRQIFKATESMGDEQQEQDELHALNRRLEKLKQIASPEVSSLVAELMSRNVSGQDILLAISAGKPKEKGEEEEVTASSKTLPDDFDPQPGRIE